MDFEWDPEKAESNLRKHGITFDFATNVFADPNLVEQIDESQSDELRWIVIGQAQEFILVVVYTVRDEAIRIISARKATKREYFDYWNREISL